MPPKPVSIPPLGANSTWAFGALLPAGAVVVVGTGAVVIGPVDDVGAVAVVVGVVVVVGGGACAIVTTPSPDSVPQVQLTLLVGPVTGPVSRIE